MIGKRLGNWEIVKELGRGGMGCVYLAREAGGDRQAAIKVLSAELAQDGGFLQRFHREIDTLHSLDHPNIVRLYESGHENGTYFYVMEYIDGQSLQELLDARGRLPWAEVLDAVLQICPALKHAHDHGIVHRDIKPPNLLRARGGVVKLTDFGIAKVFAGTHLTAAGGVVGTAEYLSPEQAVGKPATRRSDLYSLGVVLYTLLTGRTPFVGESMVELLHKHCYAQFDRPIKIVPAIPRELDEAVCQLLQKDPADRPADAGVLARQLAGIQRKLDRKDEGTDPGVPHDPTFGANAPPGANPGPGPATVMSQLMRAELEQQNRPSSLSQAINRVWVLLPLFVVCVALIAWSFWPASAESLFRQGADLMARKDPASWERAWSEYLEPLNERYPDHPYRAEVEEFRRRKDAAHTLTEPQRFFQEGERLLRAGKSAAAARLWKNVMTVFRGVDSAKEWVSKAEKGLAELDKTGLGAEQLASVHAALNRAKTLNDQGRRQEAEQIWDGIEDLYRDDYSARDVLKEVRAARALK